MGIVYEATDPALDRAVALKVVLGVRGTEAIARLSREAQAVAKLSHPNVVAVYDFGNESGQPYIVMELVEGQSVAQWLKLEPPWREIVGVFANAARGLAAAHAAGLVHRDFKPANVLHSADGVVKVLDFGLARAPSSADRGPVDAWSPSGVGDASNLATLTEAGVALGTPPYMAPEQHRGEPVGAASDAYAFGVALYRALTGRHPFVSENHAELLQAKMRGLPEAAPNDVVSRNLYAIIRRLTDPDPRTRERDLHRVARGLARIARRRRRAQWWVGGGVGAALAGSLLFLGRDPSPPASRSSEPDVVADEALEAEARELVDSADDLLERGDVAAAIGNANAAYFKAVEANSARERTRALGAVALGWHDGGSFESSAELLREAMDASVDAGLGLRAVRLSAEHAVALHKNKRQEEFTEAIRETQALAQRFELEADPRVRARILMLQGVEVRADVDSARAKLLEAVQILRDGGDVVRGALLARALRRLALYEIELHPDDARVHITEARRLLAQTQTETGLGIVRVDQTITEVNRALGDYRGCIETGTSVYERASGPSVGVKPDAAMLVASCAAALQDNELALAWTDRAADLEKSGLMTSRQRMALANRIGTTYAMLGRLDDAEAAYLRAIVMAESIGDSNIRARLLMNLHSHYETRDMEHAAARTFKELLATVEDDGVPDAVRREAWVRAADRLVDAGEFDAAAQRLDKLDDLALLPNTRDRANAARATYLRGRIAHARGEFDEGLALARTGLSQMPADRAVDEIRKQMATWIRDAANAR